MSFYKYSVKTLLSDYFGENAIFEMRKPHKSAFKDENSQQHILELCWQYANERAIDAFTEANYLIETYLEDDYIAYTYQFADTKRAFLMFMVTEDEPIFHMDVQYAKALIEEWSSKGFETTILRECVGVIYYGNNQSDGFYLGTHGDAGRGSASYKVKKVNGKDILVFDRNTCWDFYYQKLLSAFKSQDIKEYECLFEPDVELTAGEEQHKTFIGKGIPLVKDFLTANSPVKQVYQEFHSTNTYTQEIVAGDNRLILYVDRCNLISEINLCKIKNKHIIVDNDLNKYGRLQDKIPEIRGFRALDPVQMHGYVIQIDYGDDNIRNYYLASFEDLLPPEELDIDGYRFSKDVLKSAKIDEGNLSFNNGYIIPRHILYYRSFRQVKVVYTGNTVYSDSDITIRSVYKLPLKQFFSHFSIKQYWGFPDECYGPKEAWLDDQGLRSSDIALYSIDKNECGSEAAIVCVEPTAKYGYLKKDGSWFLPPIYDSVEPFSEGCAQATRNKNGKEYTCLITESGKALPLDFPIDIKNFFNNRCPFNAEEWRGSSPDKGEWHDYRWVKPGKWGVIDSTGKIIVEPKYVYIIGYSHSDGEHSIVARFVNHKLKWGVIDLEGNEVVPCEYAGMFNLIGSESIAFQREQHGLYGVMDYNGNILLEPMLEHIEEYDAKHSLVTGGEHDNALGVYSIKLKKMIIPAEYGYIDYGEHIISCEESYSCKNRYYDYDGNELRFDEYDSVYESKGLLHIRKNGKVGVMDWEGNIIVPPVTEYGFASYIQQNKRGILITGDRKLKGLAKTSGEIILPEVYSKIRLFGDFVIASKQNDTNWCIKDTLFSIDGKVILEGLYRNMSIFPESKTMTIETPTGLEFFEIETSKSLRA